MPSVFRSKAFTGNLLCTPQKCPQDFILHLHISNSAISDAVINPLMNAQLDSPGEHWGKWGWILRRTEKDNRQVSGLQELTIWLERQGKRVRKNLTT